MTIKNDLELSLRPLRTRSDMHAKKSPRQSDGCRDVLFNIEGILLLEGWSCVRDKVVGGIVGIDKLAIN